MTLKKHDAISEILSDYEKLANLVLNQLDGIKNLLNSDQQLIESEKIEILDLKEIEHKINKLEVKISEKIISAFALYQPVASEIRYLIACYRIIISLERIGDLCISISKLFLKTSNKEVYSNFSGFILKMMDLSIEMSRRSMLSFLNKDMELAKWTIKSESVVDEFNHKMLKKVAERAYFVAQDEKILISFITIKEMVSNIERISDHAANIAEASVYAVEGKDIRHHRKREVDEKPKFPDNE